MTPSFLLAAALCTVTTLLQAQEGRMAARFMASDHALNGHPAMVTVLKDGNIVAQGEIVLRDGSKGFDHLAPGSYDVRVESDGAITEVKRGVQVIADKLLELQFAMRPGQGSHTIEFASGGLTREEIAQRLQRLETAVAELQRAATHHE